MPITYSGDQEAGASGRTAAIDAALEEAVGKEEPAGLMSRPTKDNVDAPEAYTAEVEKITKAQTALTDLGFKPNGIDGNLGGGTRRAIRKFQKANGLSVTGQLDLDTVEKINSGNAVEYPDPPKPNAVVEDILPADFDIFTVEIAKIESSDRYDIMGGANNHYVGRYQMGKDALKDVGRGYNDKLNKALLNNPKEQDKLFKAYTTKNHRHLTKNSQAYRDMNPQEKLGILGYAHNQGATAAEEYLYTGVSGKDANGTKGTKYKDALAKAFEGILSMSKRPRARPTGLGS
jgi:peptidoglycan hydrolase-like protein with peptidoglycan-binding domain